MYVRMCMRICIMYTLQYICVYIYTHRRSNRVVDAKGDAGRYESEATWNPCTKYFFLPPSRIESVQGSPDDSLYGRLWQKRGSRKWRVMTRIAKPKIQMSTESSST